MTPEAMRLQQAQERPAHWRRWGPGLDGALRGLLAGHRCGTLFRTQVLLLAAHPGAVGNKVTSTSIRSGRYSLYA
jgi:hypothetical protein